MKSFFSPESVAVIGASDKPLKGGHVILKNLRALEYAGAVYPINPRLTEVQSWRAYPELGQVPGPVECVIIIVPREAVPAALRQAAEKGTQAVIVATAGFSDAVDGPGLALQAEVARIAQAAPFRMMGPNSIGTIDTRSGFISGITSHEKLPPGSVAVFGQSGMFASGFANHIRSHQRFGLSKVACLGNKQDVEEPDLLDFLAGDEASRVVGMYFEGLGDGRRFLESARRLARRKPVVVLKSGRTEAGRQAAAGHTGTLAGSDAIYDGALRQAGLQRAAGLEDFFDCLEAFAHCPIPTGDRLAVVSITGVGCVLTADAVSQVGLRFAELKPETLEDMRSVVPDWAPIRNPVDMWAAIERFGVEPAYQVLCKAVLEDPGVDALLVIFTLIEECDFAAASLLASLRRAHPDKAVVAAFLGGEASIESRWRMDFSKEGIPAFSSVDRAVGAIDALVQRGRTLRRWSERPGASGSL